jgi:hypothetical protein
MGWTSGIHNMWDPQHVFSCEDVSIIWIVHGISPTTLGVKSTKNASSPNHQTVMSWGNQQ